MYQPKWGPVEHNIQVYTTDNQRYISPSPPLQHANIPPPYARSYLNTMGYFPQQLDVDDPFYNPNLPPMQGGPPPVVKKGPKKVEGKQPTFLTKLYQILESPDYQDIIRWDDAGEMIIIERPHELAENILPLVYRQSRFASFSRQLNIYGFMRKVSLRNTERGIHDPDASTWSHPFLCRSSTRQELLSFKRRVPPRPSQAKRNLASPASSSLSPPDAYRHLLGDSDEAKPQSPESDSVWDVDPATESALRTFGPPPDFEWGRRGIANLDTGSFHAQSLPDGYNGSFYPRYSPLSDDSNPEFPPATVSPGIYQAGFSLPIQPRFHPLSPPSASTPTRYERRGSLGSPYLPRRPAPTLSGIIKTVDRTRFEERNIEDEGPPSGGLHVGEQDPFASVLPGAIGDPDGMD